MKVCTTVRLLQFKEWKAQLEKDTTSNFVQHDSSKVSKGKKYTYYYCNRSGQMCKIGRQHAAMIRHQKNQGTSVVPMLADFDCFS
jgi:hypothetical protein